MRKIGDKKRYLLSMAPNIIKGYNTGATLRELATLYETSTGSIRSLLIEEGVPLRGVGRVFGSTSTTKNGPKIDKRKWVDQQGQSLGTLYNKKLKASKARVVDWLIEKYKDVPCMDCGKVFDWCAMDFDHRPGETKELKIGSIGSRRASTPLKARIELEITKCDLVCACCHRIRTLQRSN